MVVNRRAMHFNILDENLTPEQARHVEHIGHEFLRAMSDKYIRGQREHGGNLYDKSILFLLDAMVEESIDQLVYAITLRDKVKRVVDAEVVNRDDNDNNQRTARTALRPDGGSESER